jgi:hypothetical protein
MTLPSLSALLGALCALVATSMQAQRDYFNLDAGRPTRVEDAVPTERHELEMQFASLRAERFADGSTRWRYDPKVAYGILPFTELELRAPLLLVSPPSPAPRTIGFASVAVGALHAFNLETADLPALALAGEVVLPAGSLAAPGTAFSVKALVSKTLPLVRVHVNAAAGTWSAWPAPPPPSGASCGTGQAGVPPCAYPAFPPDAPCNVMPSAEVSAQSASASCAPTAASTGGRLRAVTSAQNHGTRWTVAAGLDHALPLQSTLVVADIIAERFIGLYDPVDWTAEIGVRHQLTPQLVADVGIGWHFAGAIQSTTLSLGLGYGIPARVIPARHSSAP